MAWDVVLDKNHPCPCGKYTYREVIRMDDWNRTEETITMNCPDCKVNYVQHFYTKADGEERWYWKSKNG